MLPWLCIGNFNELISHDEKLGGALRSERLMAVFRDGISDCGLLEVSFFGSKFTWHKGTGEDAIYERLDRVLVSQSFLNLFPNAIENHIVKVAYDHDPILLNCLSIDVVTQRQWSFMFENVW